MNSPTSRRSFIGTLAALPAAFFCWRQAKAQLPLPVTALSGKVEIAGAANWVPVRAVTCRQEMYVGGRSVEETPRGRMFITLAQLRTDPLDLVVDRFVVPPFDPDPYKHRSYGPGLGTTSLYPEAHIVDTKQRMVPITNLRIDYLPWDKDARAALAEDLKNVFAIARWTE